MKSIKIKGWNLFEIIWLFVFSTVAITLSIVWKDTYLGLSVFLSGVICVVLAAKGNIWNYVFGIYNSIGYAYISYNNHLFGEVMLNILFFVPTGIIGWFMWRKKVNHSTVEMRKMKPKSIAVMILVCIAATVIYGLWLSTIKGQNTPFLDAFSVVASIIATLAMMLRYREQWIMYIGINVAETIMWSLRLANGSHDIATLIMWIAYLVNSIYGFYVWNKGSKTETVLEGSSEGLTA